MRKVLVANRSEIAVRLLRSASDLGFATVLAAAPEDADSAAAQLADEVVILGGHPPGRAYLDVPALLDAARRTGAEAVHPGYGVLSERPEFADAVLGAGLRWVGPPPAAMRRLGDKDAARAVARSVGVPVLDGTPAGVGAPPDPSAFTWPILVKAVGGGGGRGMRRVDDPSQLAGAIARASAEAVASFGRGDVFLERYLLGARHVEVQLFGDGHTLVALGDRDGSVQRRHQKVVEEAPAADLAPDVRAALADAALRIGRAAGYAQAGTAEFLVEPDGTFWFLEVNARLQVEHPTTECAYGIDLVDAMWRVAAGERMPWHPDDLVARHHAIEVRLLAEDPTADDRPAAGRVDAWSWRPAPGVRVDTGLRQGDVIHPHYDALMAKVIVWDRDRAGAIRRLRGALDHIQIAGPATNLEVLRAIAADPGWAAAPVDTSWLSMRADLRVPPNHDGLDVALAAALDAHRSAVGLAPGWRLGGPAPVVDAWRDGLGQLRTTRTTPSQVTVDAQPRAIRVCSDDGKTARVAVDGVVKTVHTPAAGPTDGAPWPVATRGLTVAPVRLSRFPDPTAATPDPSLAVAPVPGRVTAIVVAVGDRVALGDPLATLESMKVEVVLRAPASATVAGIRVPVGAAVAAGDPVVDLLMDEKPERAP